MCDPQNISLGVFMVNFPLEWVYVRHERGSRGNNMELGLINIAIKCQVVRNCGKIIIVEDRINSGLLLVVGF